VARQVGGQFHRREVPLSNADPDFSRHGYAGSLLGSHGYENTLTNVWLSLD
jgi:hypothetical protein